MPFGGLHFIAFGDFAQHQPPKSRSLFTGAANPDYTNPIQPATFNRQPTDTHAHATAVVGRRLWMEFGESIILHDQFRFGADEDGQALYDLVYKMTHNRHQDGKPLNRIDYADIADTINGRAITSEALPDFLKKAPKAMVLRHSVRPALTRLLVLHHAAASNSRAIAWRATDVGHMPKGGAGKRLSSMVEQLVENVSDNDRPPAVQYFYPGIPYRFLQSEYPSIGWFHNGECIGHSLVLDEREPADPLTGEFWVLKYPPVSIMVRIVDRKLGKMCGDGVPEDCVPVMPKSSSPVTITLPFPVKLYHDAKDKTIGSKVTIKRKDFGLDCALVFTDYYGQGQSFRGIPHFLHLNVAKTQGYQKANLLVPLSRPSRLSDVVLVHPLWSPGDSAARDNIIGKIQRALTPDKDYVAEMDRLTTKHSTTIDSHFQRLMLDPYDDIDPSKTMYHTTRANNTIRHNNTSPIPHANIPAAIRPTPTKRPSAATRTPGAPRKTRNAKPRVPVPDPRLRRCSLQMH